MSSKSSVQIMLTKAEQKFDLAKYSLDRKLFDACVSELYFSAFQTITALILAHGERTTNKHTAVRAWVNKNLAKPGKLTAHLIKTYNRLMDLRAEADYSTSIKFEQEEIELLFERVKELNTRVRHMISNDFSNQ